MSWDYRIGHAEQVTVYTGGEVIAALTAALIMDGMATDDARDKALEVWKGIGDSRKWESRSITLNNGLVLTAWHPSPKPDPSRTCGDLTRDGARCGRHLNHPGEC